MTNARASSAAACHQSSATPCVRACGVGVCVLYVCVCVCLPVRHRPADTATQQPSLALCMLAQSSSSPPFPLPWPGWAGPSFPSDEPPHDSSTRPNPLTIFSSPPALPLLLLRLLLLLLVLLLLLLCPAPLCCIRVDGAHVTASVPPRRSARYRQVSTTSPHPQQHIVAQSLAHSNLDDHHQAIGSQAPLSSLRRNAAFAGPPLHHIATLPICHRLRHRLALVRILRLRLRLRTRAHMHVLGHTFKIHDFVTQSPNASLRSTTKLSARPHDLNCALPPSLALQNCADDHCLV